MTKAQASAYERLYDQFCLPFSETPVVPETLRSHFDHSDRPLILEIGFGMGRTTAELAEKWQFTNFLGIEVHRPGVAKLLHEIEVRALRNVLIIQHDAVDVLQQMLPYPMFDGLHLFFPDPWPKKRHHKRRLIRPGITDLLRGRLIDGGYIYVTTDWRDYGEQILAVLSATPGLYNPYDGFAPRQEWRPQTAFERKGLAKEHAIYEVYLEKHE
jgi:tRNA (guanine-N7-)-methyltransferase